MGIQPKLNLSLIDANDPETASHMSAYGSPVDADKGGPRLPGIRAQYLKAPEPKQLIVLDGNAHAQFLFQTDQADRVMDEIFRFLSAP
jgi:hypothetical protein